MLVLGESIYVGNSAITQVYQGNNLIWPAASGDSYYYYYQSPGGMSIQEAIEAFYYGRNIGPIASSTTQFDFLVQTKYNGSLRTSSVACFAIPQHKEATRVIDNKQDITPKFNKLDVVLDGIPYYLYYYNAVWVTTNILVYTEPCFYYLSSTATTIDDAIIDFSDNRKYGNFISGNTNFSFTAPEGTNTIVFALPSYKTVTSVYRNNPEHPIEITNTLQKSINDIPYTVYAAPFSPPFSDNWSIVVITN